MHGDTRPGEDGVQRGQEGHEKTNGHLDGKRLGWDAEAGQIEVNQIGEVFGHGIGCQRP